MTLENLLETFETKGRATKDNSVGIDATEVERIRSEAFETGYASGWEDANRTEKDARLRIEAEFERNIQNLVFTYSEAVDCVRGELKNFLSAILDTFLPDIVPDLTREHVRSELLKIADDLVEAPIEIVTAPDARPLLEELLEKDFSRTIGLVEDATLASRQVYIRIAEREVEVNISPLVDVLRAQLQAVAEKDPKRINDVG